MVITDIVAIVTLVVMGAIGTYIVVLSRKKK
jgi:hypothetical protein